MVTLNQLVADRARGFFFAKFGLLHFDSGGMPYQLYSVIPRQNESFPGQRMKLCSSCPLTAAEVST